MKITKLSNPTSFKALFKFNEVIIVFIIGFICSCKFRSPLPIITKGETIDAIVGKWGHQDLNKSAIKNIVFTNKKNTTGDCLYIITYQKKDSNGNILDTGTWHYAGVGKIEISDMDKVYTLHFEFVNNYTLKLEEDDVYVKDK